MIVLQWNNSRLSSKAIRSWNLYIWYKWMDKIWIVFAMHASFDQVELFRSWAFGIYARIGASCGRTQHTHTHIHTNQRTHAMLLCTVTHHVLCLLCDHFSYKQVAKQLTFNRQVFHTNTHRWNNIYSHIWIHSFSHACVIFSDIDFEFYEVIPKLWACVCVCVCYRTIKVLCFDYSLLCVCFFSGWRCRCCCEIQHFYRNVIHAHTYYINTIIHVSGHFHNNSVSVLSCFFTL